MPDQPEVKGQTAEPVLRLLSELGATVDHTETDVRGLRVEDENGEAVGTVTDLVVDDVEKSGHFLVAVRGGFLGLGTRHTYSPVQAVARDTENAVRLAHPRSHIMSAPAYAPTWSTTGPTGRASTTTTATHPSPTRTTAAPSCPTSAR